MRSRSRPSGWFSAALHAVGRRVGLTLVFFGRALPLLVILGGVAVGAYKLWERALADPRFVVGGDTLALAGAAEECPEAQEELTRLARAAEGRNLLDPTLPTDLRRVYESSPWVRGVEQIRRTFPNRVTVMFRLRLPVAQVRQNGQYYLLDRDARRLPAAPTAEPAAGLAQIAGSTRDVLGACPATGEVWGGTAVPDALGLLYVLWGSSLADTIAPDRMVVSGGEYLDRFQARRAVRPRYAVETKNRRVIHWGTFNRGDLPGELTSGEKLAMIRELLQTSAAGAGLPLDVRTRIPGFSARP